MYKRNPDEAEEDDIGPSELQSSTRRRGSLLKELRRYNDTYTPIQHQKRKRAKEIVEDIKCSLRVHLKKDPKTPYTFGNFMHQGSSYEGLKVVEPDEFDLLLPLVLKDSDWNYKEWRHEDGVKLDDKDQAPSCFFIKKIGRNKTNFDNGIANYVYLSPIKIKRKMQSTVQRAVGLNNMDLPNVQSVTLQESGPALTLEVRYDNSLRMSIDIVPAIKLRDKLDKNKYRFFVAKRHPKADQYQSPCRNDQNLYNHIWRESFSEEEKSRIREMDHGKDECRRDCLKILKTILVRSKENMTEKRAKECPLAMLSSYHLKICMLYLNDANPIDIVSGGARICLTEGPKSPTGGPGYGPGGRQGPPEGIFGLFFPDEIGQGSPTGGPAFPDGGAVASSAPPLAPPLTELWHKDNLADRFKNLLQILLKFLIDKKMPCYFSRTVDLFTPFDGPDLRKIRVWLSKIVCSDGSDDKIIDELLSDRVIQDEPQAGGVKCGQRGAAVNDQDVPQAGRWCWIL